ncbi:2-oxoglutarate dehydrogenase complex dihydrolipoyllysine-residue succinyltransferase [Thiolapillus brandeum]|uniref:Dihydrolipoyllysine-residue succinyltransferase component of 2-oxoglutarate dehydrogenase complex n=1 Tax=Thiolapillus brandeum TaxID=1076588 RepID=A0A7U6JI70_9GAMM|nr:2-oxoglutarate dehydrogenase complex dihydrolipoyllysine-residue succinyltransferase [Thiolapillus brandeum]BAO44527.1 2-oxoglutarate dehydrogenase E2 component [Thiolapillus brandeum]
MSTEIRVPTLPESVTDATVLSWHKQPGDSVRRDENILDLETDKVVLEVPSPVDGTLVELRANEGDLVEADDILAIIEPGKASAGTTAAPAADASAPAEKPPTATPAAPAKDEPVLTPAVRRLVRELKLDPRQITGTGKDGRILKSDVMTYLDQQTSSRDPDAETVASMVNESPLPASTAHAEQRVPMSRLRARIAERLVEAQQTAAILTTFNEVNLQAVSDLRARHRDHFEQNHGVRLGFMSFFVKAAVDALKKFPLINASVDGTDIVYHGYYDIGIAVGSPRGLVVPILRNADQLSFADIEKTIRQFGRKAQDGSLSYEELSGGTFTISNGGVYGSMLSTPILNPPQSGILGMHNIIQRPVAENGEVVIRPMMYLALSYDHRIVDGKDAVQFLVAIKDNLEDPSRLLLEL